ncbi:MAG: NPCBM/NEW2 domain-containing protein [Armatimonadetes bacterium]|nr:NPCBM/NEW2 domain-containing protein [Armatimonadota bacterium]
MVGWFLALPLAVGMHDIDLASFDVSQIAQGWGSAQRNKSVDGKPISLGGRTFEKGIGTHAESVFMVRLDGQPFSFKSTVGVEDEVGKQGSVVFVILGDNKVLFRSAVIRGGDQPIDVSLSNRGIKILTLKVEDGGDDINYDHATWANPVISVAEGGKWKAPTMYSLAPEPTLPVAMKIPEYPEINGAAIAGTTAGKPFVFRVPVTGARPMVITATGLPKGITLNSNGVISGAVAQKGRYKVQVTAKNKYGTARQTLTIDSTGKLALTPPMGWNSWNVWGLDVDQKKMADAARVLVESGLADSGYQYVNIDDAWESTRTPDGFLYANAKFPDMHALGNTIHGYGLRFGIYSSPGPRTCGGYTGSYGFELNDAKTWADWGIDYLKYDWCSYTEITTGWTLADYKRPYQVMQNALSQVNRDIVYSMCQYGMGDVYKWGTTVGGQLWRTTGDISDSWASMSQIGFSHDIRSPYVQPGGWNDPDMLVLGKVGWSRNLRSTRLKPNEQITHMTLWSMLAAPLLIGCDLTQLDPFTKALLCNREVIAIDQDPLGKAAVPVYKQGTMEIWTRPLADGSTAMAVFNRGMSSDTISGSASKLHLKSGTPLRNCWTRKEAGRLPAKFKFTVPGHGALLYRVGP